MDNTDLTVPQPDEDEEYVMGILPKVFPTRELEERARRWLNDLFNNHRISTNAELQSVDWRKDTVTLTVYDPPITSLEQALRDAGVRNYRIGDFNEILVIFGIEAMESMARKDSLS